MTRNMIKSIFHRCLYHATICTAMVILHPRPEVTLTDQVKQSRLYGLIWPQKWICPDKNLRLVMRKYIFSDFDSYWPKLSELESQNFGYRNYSQAIFFFISWFTDPPTQIFAFWKKIKILFLTFFIFSDVKNCQIKKKKLNIKKKITKIV